MAERITVTRTKPMSPDAAGIMVDVLDSLANPQVPALKNKERIEVSFQDREDLWKISLQYVGLNERQVNE